MREADEHLLQTRDQRGIDQLNRRTLPVRSKRERYASYARRGGTALRAYCESLAECGLLEADAALSGAFGGEHAL